jgi:nucleoside-diphosphate-sugar epimerase
MRVFVAGASGVIGRSLVPRLAQAGHDVVGMTRSPSKQNLVRGLGAQPVVADALDPDAVAQAVAAAEPEVIVHELTSLSGPMSMKAARHPERFEGAIMTGRLRTEATDHLLAAGRAVGARRFVAQSFGAFRLTRAGGPAQAEDEPIEPGPYGRQQPGLDAILYLERAVTSIDWAEGLALRYGGFYGPGTAISLDPDAVLAGPVRRRRFPIVGKGDGITSYVHIDDAAAATVTAVERGGPGVYNVVDDEPAAQREWLPVLADALGAKPPRRMPRWLVRLLAGEMATAMMTEAKGSSNLKAKRELGWELRYPSWRQGFAEGLRERDD